MIANHGDTVAARRANLVGRVVHRPRQGLAFQRRRTVRFRPACNVNTELEKKPDYKIRTKSDLETPNSSEKNLEDSEKKIPCPCCGSEMKIAKVLENTTIVKCSICGLSDTRLNS